MSLRSPLGQARGLGSAKDGTHHFWVQRVSAVALVPLSLWFIFSVAKLSGGDYEAVKWWASYPAVAITLVLFLGATLYHSMLGVQVVIEDYVGNEAMKITALLVSKFFHFAVAVAAIFAVLKLAFS